MNFDFYKNKFEREQKRRVDLDNATNLPILVSTLIMGLNSYIISKHIFNQLWNLGDRIVITLLLLSAILILVSSYFIFLAVNNSFKGFNYPNFDLMIVYREIELYNKRCHVEDIQDIEKIVTDKLVMYADESTIINDIRAENLFHSRRILMSNFIFTTINIIIVTSINILI